MFVTSDIFDLKRIGQYRDINWQENLLCGVNVLGSRWTGPEMAATFLLESAKICGLLEGMQYCGYGRRGESRTRSIAGKSLDRLARGELKGAQGARAVVLRGHSPAQGTKDEDVCFGGEASRSQYANTIKNNDTIQEQPESGKGDFLFPKIPNHMDIARSLLILSANSMNTEYGYYFIRDELCLPSGYCCGISAPLDYGKLASDDAKEIGDWVRFTRGKLWTDKWPVLRDLYQMNLLSERHTAQPVEGLGHLTEWIAAQQGRGQLEDIGRGRVLWTLNDAEIFNVRPILHAAGLLFSCRERVYRDLPGGLAPSQRPDTPPRIR